MDLIETNNQTNMTLDHSVSNNNSLKSFLDTKSFNSCVRHGHSTSVSVARVMWMYKYDVNSASFNGDSNEETFNINKSCWQ